MWHEQFSGARDQDTEPPRPKERALDLVRRAQEGDLGAFETLVAEHTDTTYRLAAAIVGEADARDITQDAIVAAWVHIGRLRQPDRFAAWLHRIVVNGCRKHLRSRRRHGVSLSLERPEPESDDPAPIGERLTDPSSEFHGAVHARATLEPAFEALSPDQRALLALHYSLGYSIREAAETLDVPVGTAKSRLNKALSVLREAIEEDAVR